MPKTARRKVESGIYHIVLRGGNKQTIFYEDELSRRISIILKTKNIYDILKCGREEINEVLDLLKQNTVGASIRQISRVTGLLVSIIRTIK